jgi:hypothetical protein
LPSRSLNALLRLQAAFLKRYLPCKFLTYLTETPELPANLCVSKPAKIYSQPCYISASALKLINSPG